MLSYLIPSEPGVRTSENKYTCPVLSVHLYRHSQVKGTIANDQRIIIVDNGNQQQTHQGPQKATLADQVTVEEDMQILPVEDVLKISSRAEMKKKLQAEVTKEVIPVYERTENRCDRCCAPVFSCCRKMCDSCCCCRQGFPIVPGIVSTVTFLHDEDPNRKVHYDAKDINVPEESGCTLFCDQFRCWCCRREKLVKKIEKTKTVEEKEATRVIKIIIECIPYSNLDSASNPRLLNSEQKLSVYKDQFATNKLEFYLINSTEFQQANFTPSRDEAERLCRTVMHLKAMKDNYPSEKQLQDILNQSEKRTFGDEYQEPTLQLPNILTTVRKNPEIQEVPQAHRQPPIQPQQIAALEHHGKAQEKVIEPDTSARKDDS